MIFNPKISNKIKKMLEAVKSQQFGYVIFKFDQNYENLILDRGSKDFIFSKILSK